MTQVDEERRRFLGAATMMLTAPFGWGSTQARLPVEGELASFGGATEWLNTPPLTAQGLRGKVVLVNFCTYTCINWLRSLPYVRAWARRYQDQGLVVIGVHTPEFSFEKNMDNVRRAVRDMQVDYPVAVDSRYGIWRAFGNQYWPATYLADAKGRIRFHHFGEGEYDKTEAAIRQLLTDAGNGNIGQQPATVTATGIEVPADWNNLRSPESYTGHDRTDNFASAGGATLNKARTYAVPPQLKLNKWALSGDWTFGREAVALNKPGGRIAFRFHARDLHLVMGPAAGRSSVPFRVLLDGKAPGDARGTDTNTDGGGNLDTQRLYQLIRQRQAVADRLFEIEFLDAGAEAFAFTFG